MALLLAPLFSEVSLLGVTLKQKIDSIKDHVTTEMASFKNEVRTAIALQAQANVTQSFNIPGPAPDSQLPEIERRVRLAVSEALASHGLQQQPPPAQIPVPQDVELLFATRYNLEKELRRIGESRQLTGLMGRPQPAMQITRRLLEAELLEAPLANAIREVYSVCSPAVHGEPVTAAQVAFVRDTGPSLVSALRAIT